MLDLPSFCLGHEELVVVDVSDSATFRSAVTSSVNYQHGTATSENFVGIPQVLRSIGHCCLDAAVPSHLRRQCM